MNAIELIGTILILSLISLVACRLWILFWDTVGRGLNLLNPFRKKNKVPWHSLDESKMKEVDKDSVKAKDEQIYIDEREW